MSNAGKKGKRGWAGSNDPDTNIGRKVRHNWWGEGRIINEVNHPDLKGQHRHTENGGHYVVHFPDWPKTIQLGKWQTDPLTSNPLKFID